MAEQYTQKAITDQQSGMYRILTDEMELDKVEAQLLVEMLEDRPEIAYLDDLGDELCIKLNPQYVHEEKELPRLSQEDADVICAKHVLWLHDAGGEQADFSGYDLSGLNLSHRNLNSAIFAGTRMYETNLAQTELCFSDFTEAFGPFVMIMFTIFTGSIAGGISAGIIAHGVIKLLTGRWKEVHPFLYVLCIPLILYFLS